MSGITERRRPRVAVAFLGEETIIAGEETHLLSVTTTKALNNPAGTFEILLKASSPIVVASADILTSQRPSQYQSTENRTSRFLSPKGDVSGTSWLNALQPMMVVMIAYSVNGEPSFSDLTMLGLIDMVTLETSISGVSPSRIVRVQGRDLAKVFLEDGNYTPLGLPSENQPVLAVGAPRTTSTGPGLSDEDFQALLSRYFKTGDADNWRRLLGVGLGGTSVAGTPLTTLVPVLLQAAPSAIQRLANGKTVLDYLPGTNVLIGETAITAQVYSNNLLSQTGTIWGLLRSLTPPPMFEVFVDTVGAQAQLVVRRPPFGRPTVGGRMGQEEKLLSRLADILRSRTATSSTTTPSVTVASSFNAPLFPNGDEFVTTPRRLPSTSPADAQPYHVVQDDELISISLSKHDREVMTWMHLVSVLDSSRDVSSSIMIIPPILDAAAAIRFGLRAFSTTSPVVKETQSLQTANAFGANSFAAPGDQQFANFVQAGARDNLRAYYYFRDNSAYFSGVMTIRGRPNIRIGDRVLLPSYGDTLCYVEAVSNSWSIGQPFVTTIALSRAQPLALNGRVATYDVDPEVSS